ncbi:MAG: polyprenyl synthetase family protein [Myxococcales bacterium]|nr:polyprenyl synthetase family protein [Myxococcales bacterium]
MKFTPAALEGLRDQHWPQIIAELQSVVPPSDDPGSLSDMTWYHLQTGGKRLRAILPLAVVQTMGLRPEAAIGLGAAVEMLHNATLVHDDLQDGDTHRRGKPTVWSHYGTTQAINCGDAMFYYSIALAQRITAPSEVIHRIVDTLVGYTLAVIAGQVDEFRFKERTQPTVADYFRIARGKTSGLFALPLVGAGILAGASEKTLRTLESVGEKLGVLFQIQDDLLDITGNKGRDRKGTDIAEGKITLMTVHALENLPREQALELHAILRLPRDHTEDTHITRALALLEASGGIARAIRYIDDVVQEIHEECKGLENRALATVLVGFSDIFLEPIRSLVHFR